MGWARASVGVALIVAPKWPLRVAGREEPTAASVLLLRTIGIRDVVLGCGTILAERRGVQSDLRRWTSMGLASDSLDVLASLLGRDGIGPGASLSAAVAALLFALGDLSALGSLSRT
jgi:hypothetical protein